MSEQLVRIDYDEVFNETDAAILFCIEKAEIGQSEETRYVWTAWVPKSQIDDHNEQEHYFTIPEWLAMEKGLI